MCVRPSVQILSSKFSAKYSSETPVDAPQGKSRVIFFSFAAPVLPKKILLFSIVGNDLLIS